MSTLGEKTSFMISRVLDWYDGMSHICKCCVESRIDLQGSIGHITGHASFYFKIYEKSCCSLVRIKFTRISIYDQRV